METTPTSTHRTRAGLFLDQLVRIGIIALMLIGLYGLVRYAVSGDRIAGLPEQSSELSTRAN